MQKITTKIQYERLNGLPPPVTEEIKRNVELLNLYYGENRNADENLGGYVLLIEDERDFKELEKIFSCKAEQIITEYTDVIQCKLSA